MIKKLKHLSLSVAAFLLTAMPIFAPAMVSAQLADDLCDGATSASGEGTECETVEGESTLRGLMRDIVRYFSIIVGAISIVMIIFGGFRYITSGGDSAKVTTAKNTIMYALIGLVLVALAQVMVNLVVTQASDIGTDSTL